MIPVSFRPWMAAIATVGIGLGWWYDRMGLMAELHEATQRVEVLEWQPTDVWTMGGSWNFATIREVIQEDEVQRKRFARQLPPKSESDPRARPSRLRSSKH